MRADEDLLTRDSYYLASVPGWPPAAPLAGATSCDVCVVGGGIAGLSAALDLRAAGRDVVLLEGRSAGWGASGRNGGQALTGLACEMAVVERQLGREAARAIWDLSVAAVALIGERCREHGIDCDWQDGFLAAAVNEHKARALRAGIEAMERDYGAAPQRWIGPAEVRGWIDSPRYVAAAYDAGGGHLHPLKYTLGLARAARAAGVRLHEGTRAVAVERGSMPRVRTPAGSVRCRQLVLAGNVYLEGLVPDLSARIMPVGTYIAATAPLGRDRAQRLIPSRAAVCDTQFVLDYFRLSADDRLVFGGRVSYSTVAPPRLRESMGRRMLAVFPQLAGVAIEHSWGGYVDITMNRAPDFGRTDGNIYYLQGFSGHGLALTGMAGRMVAQAIGGDAAQFDLFARLRHRPFPGGRMLRTPALVLAMLWYRMRDLLG